MKELALSVVARGVVVDAIAIADVQLGLGAEAPERVLDEARKYDRESRIEGAGVNLMSELPDDVGAAPWSITARAISVMSVEGF